MRLEYGSKARYVDKVISLILRANSRKETRRYAYAHLHQLHKKPDQGYIKCEYITLVAYKLTYTQ